MSNDTRRSTERWTDWARTAPQDLKDAVATVWHAFGPVALVHADAPPHCLVCGGHNRDRYGSGGNPVCLDCQAPK